MKQPVSLKPALYAVLTFLAFLLLPGAFEACQKPPDTDTTTPPLTADTIDFKVEGVVVSNGKVTSLGYNTVRLQGVFKKLVDSSFHIVDYGYVVSSVTNRPTLDDYEFYSQLGERNNVGAFDSEITGLAENTVYYARVYLKRKITATGAIEIGYHPYALSFRTTPVTPPVLANEQATNITLTSFQANAILADPNFLTIEEHGHLWSETNPSPDLSAYEGKTTLGALQTITTHNFSSTVSGLKEATAYYVRAYATNQHNLTGYSPAVIVTTQAPPPDLKIAGYETLTGDALEGRAEQLRLVVANSGIGIAKNVRIVFADTNIEALNPQQLELGEILPGKSKTIDLDFKILKVNFEQEMYLPLTLTSDGGFAWHFNNSVRLIALPVTDVENGLLRYFRFNRSLVDEITHTTFAFEHIPVYRDPMPGTPGNTLPHDNVANADFNYIEFATPPELQYTPQVQMTFTLNFWVKLDAWPSNFDFNLNSPGDPVYGWNSAFKFILQDVDYSGALSVNQVLTCYGIGTSLNLGYIYGNLLTSEWKMVTLTVRPGEGKYRLEFTGLGFYEGVYNYGNWVQTTGILLRGLAIDNLRIYNRVLSSEERDELYFLKK